MIKLTKYTPNVLMGMEFNIPLFRADKQMYLCIDVSEIATSPGGKDYNIKLREIKGLNYAVPERVDVNMFIPTDTGEYVHITMNEVDRNDLDIKLSQTLTSKEHISSLSGFKEVLYNMANDKVIC